jgi:hypothetical protein
MNLEANYFVLTGSVVYHWFSAIGCRSGTRSADDSPTLVKLSKDRMEILHLFKRYNLLWYVIII